MNLHDAIFKLNSNVVTIRGDVAYDQNETVVEYDLAACEALIAANAYKDQRAAEYPSIVDQLDVIFHGGLDVWKEQIQAI